MEEVVGGAIRTRRWMATLLATLAMLALALAVAGTYAVMARAVEGRVQEIGVRMALGAGPPQVLRLILRRGAMLTSLGGAVGLVLALGLTRTMTGLIVGVERRRSRIAGRGPSGPCDARASGRLPSREAGDPHRPARRPARVVAVRARWRRTRRW